MHYRVNWINTTMIYTPINFKSFIERVSDVPLFKNVDKDGKKRFEITSIEGYGTQHLQKKNNEKDALVFYKDNKVFKNTDRKIVTMTIRGRYSLGDLEGNVHIRLFEPSQPKKGKKVSGNHSAVSCKFSFKNNDKAGALVKTENQINKSFEYVTKNLTIVLDRTPKSDINISGMFATEMSLLSPEDGKVLEGNALPYQKVQKLFKKIDEIVSKQGYSYDKVTNQKNGKKLSGKFFKPILANGSINNSKSRPTIAVMNTMNVQATGKYTIPQLRQTFRMFIDAFKEASKDMALPKPTVPQKTFATSITHCRKNTPEMKTDGTCTGGRIPKVSKGNVCCYNETLYPGKARKYVQEFKQLNIPLPKVYEKYKDSSWKVEKYKDEKTKKNALRIAIKRGDDMIYKPWVCEKQSVDDIKRIGKELLKLEMKGKKIDLCKRIEEHLNPKVIAKKPKKEKVYKPKPPIFGNPIRVKKGIRMGY